MITYPTITECRYIWYLNSYLSPINCIYDFLSNFIVFEKMNNIMTRTIYKQCSCSSVTLFPFVFGSFASSVLILTIFTYLVIHKIEIYVPLFVKNYLLTLLKLKKKLLPQYPNFNFHYFGWPPIYTWWCPLLLCLLWVVRNATLYHFGCYFGIYNPLFLLFLLLC